MSSPLRTDAFHRDPFPVYRWLRDAHPVFHDRDRDAYVITRYADVVDAARDHGVFSSVDPAPDVFDRMTRMDPPRHDQWRSLTLPRFRPRAVATLAESVRAIARDLVASALAAGSPIDVVRDVAGPLPSTVIGDLIGVPRELNPRFHELSMVSIAGAPADADAANHEMYAMLEPLIAARRADPRDDIVSLLVHGTVDGRPLTERELLGYCLHLMVAGNDTTTNLIASGTYLLGHHPDVRARLAADPTLVPQAIEEMIRHSGPVQMLPRRMAVTTERHGVTLPQGALVELYWGAANRDERRFAHPDTFDIDRTDQGHLGFGHGVHFCLGAHLARLEARAAFDELLRAWPDYRLVPGQPLDIKPGWAIRGYRAVLIEG